MAIVFQSKKDSAIFEDTVNNFFKNFNCSEVLAGAKIDLFKDSTSLERILEKYVESFPTGEEFIKAITSSNQRLSHTVLEDFIK
jgi:hypothetical protein